MMPKEARHGQNDRRQRQTDPCQCGHFERFHERIWDPEADPEPRYFTFCRGCDRDGKSAHHDFRPVSRPSGDK